MCSETQLHRNDNCRITIHVNIIRPPSVGASIAVEISKGVSSFWYRQMRLSQELSCFSLFTCTKTVVELWALYYSTVPESLSSYFPVMEQNGT
jgi:hypothetical protein